MIKNAIRMIAILLSMCIAESNATFFSAKPLFDTALVCMANQDYSRAQGLFGALLKDDPNDMNALYFRLACQQTMILDYESYIVEEKKFLKLADSILVVLQKRRPRLSGREALKCLFYEASVYGGKAIIQAKVGKWTPAVFDASTAVKMYNQVLRIDPGFYPAYLGPGVFKYYLSVNLRWMPMVGNRSFEGIQNVKTATHSPYPYNLAANIALCWIQIDQKKYRDADQIASDVLSRLPWNTMYLRLKANTALILHNYPVCVQLSEKLKLLSRNRQPANWSDLLSSYNLLAKSYDGLKDKEKVSQVTLEGLAIQVPSPQDQIPYIQWSRDDLSRLHDKYLSAKGK